MQTSWKQKLNKKIYIHKEKIQKYIKITLIGRIKNVTHIAVMLPPNSDSLVDDCWTSIPNFFLATCSLSVLAGSDLFRPFPRSGVCAAMSAFYTYKICLSTNTKMLKSKTAYKQVSK